MGTGHSFLKTNLAILLIANVGNGCTFIFQLLCGRILGPANYGIFNAVNSAFMLLTICTSVLPLVISKSLLKRQAACAAVRAGLLRYFLRRLIAFSACAVFLWLAVLFYFRDIFNTTMAIAVFTSISIHFLFLTPLLLGMLQARLRFVANSCMLSSLAVLKLIFLGIFIASDRVTVPIIFLVDCCSGGVIFFIVLVMLRKEFTGPSQPPSPESIRNAFFFFLPAMLTAFGVASLGNLDVVLAKRFCSAEAAGAYSAASVLGKVPFFATQALVGVLFPTVLNKAAEGKENMRRLAGCCALIISIGAVYIAGIWLTGDCIPVFLYGDAYAQIAALLVVASIANTLLAVGNIIFIFCLAVRRYAFLSILGAGLVGLCLAVIGFFHETSMHVGLSVLAAVAGIVIFTVLWLKFSPSTAAYGPA